MEWGTSEKQRTGCCGHRSPLAAKGPPSGVRQEPASHNHTIPLSSLYFFHASQSKSSILTWFLAMKLAQHKPVNVLSLKLACQLKIRTPIPKLFRQLSFMGSQPLRVGFSLRPSSEQRSLFFFNETTCRKAKIITTVSIPSTLLRGILPLFGGSYCWRGLEAHQASSRGSS